MNVQPPTMIVIAMQDAPIPSVHIRVHATMVLRTMASTVSVSKNTWFFFNQFITIK